MTRNQVLCYASNTDAVNVRGSFKLNIYLKYGEFFPQILTWISVVVLLLLKDQNIFSKRKAGIKSKEGANVLQKVDRGGEKNLMSY